MTGKWRGPPVLISKSDLWMANDGMQYASMQLQSRSTHNNNTRYRRMEITDKRKGQKRGEERQNGQRGRDGSGFSGRVGVAWVPLASAWWAVWVVQRTDPELGVLRIPPEEERRLGKGQ